MVGDLIQRGSRGERGGSSWRTRFRRRGGRGTSDRGVIDKERLRPESGKDDHGVSFRTNLTDSLHGDVDLMTRNSRHDGSSPGGWWPSCNVMLLCLCARRRRPQHRCIAQSRLGCHDPATHQPRRCHVPGKPPATPPPCPHDALAMSSPCRGLLLRSVRSG